MDRCISEYPQSNGGPRSLPLKYPGKATRSKKGSRCVVLSHIRDAFVPIVAPKVEIL